MRCFEHITYHMAGQLDKGLGFVLLNRYSVRVGLVAPGSCRSVMSSNRGSKHETILNAAVKVFARQGFHHSRIADIAEEAGVASGTIYLYFRNKDDVLISVFEESLDHVIREIKAELDKLSSPEDKLSRVIDLHLKMLKEHRDIAEVLQVELRQSHKFMKEYEPVRWIEYLDIIGGVLQEGQKQGVFRKDLSLSVFKRAVFGAMDEIALYWVVAKKDEKYLEQAARELARLMLEGLGARESSGASYKSSARGSFGRAGKG